MTTQTEWKETMKLQIFLILLEIQFWTEQFFPFSSCKDIWPVISLFKNHTRNSFQQLLGEPNSSSSDVFPSDLNSYDLYQTDPIRIPSMVLELACNWGYCEESFQMTFISFKWYSSAQASTGR